MIGAISERHAEFIQLRDETLRKLKPLLSIEGYQNAVQGLYAAENVSYGTRYMVETDKTGKIKIVKK